MVKQLRTSSEIETGCSVKSFDFHRCQVGCHPDRLVPLKSSKPVQIKIHLTSRGLHFLRGELGGWLFWKEMPAHQWFCLKWQNSNGIESGFKWMQTGNSRWLLSSEHHLEFCLRFCGGLPVYFRLSCWDCWVHYQFRCMTFQKIKCYRWILCRHISKSFYI